MPDLLLEEMQMAPKKTNDNKGFKLAISNKIAEP